MREVRHGGPILVLNSDGVRLGRFPTTTDAEAWMGWQNIRSERKIPMRWVDTSDPLWRLLGLQTRPLLDERTVTT